MDNLHYVGLDVHKKTVAFCNKLVDGKIIQKGTVSTSKSDLANWAQTLPEPSVLAKDVRKWMSGHKFIY